MLVLWCAVAVLVLCCALPHCAMHTFVVICCVVVRSNRNQVHVNAFYTHEWQVTKARLAQSAERKALNLVVVGSSPTVGAVVQKHKNLMQNLPCLDWSQWVWSGASNDLVQQLSTSWHPHPPIAPPLVLCPKTTSGGGPHWVVPVAACAHLHDGAPISHHSSPPKKLQLGGEPRDI